MTPDRSDCGGATSDEYLVHNYVKGLPCVEKVETTRENTLAVLGTMRQAQDLLVTCTRLFLFEPDI